MQPSTSSLGSASLMDSYLNSTEDCHFLLRALEKQAFENVVFAFRAQGPLTQYTELLLDHLKTALSIDDDEFNIKIRLASNNPHICRLSQQLNPSYDNDSRWVSLAYDLTGIELAKIRKIGASKNNDPKLLFKHINELHKHNTTLPDAKEALSQLMQLPEQPYVPERLRKYLRASESNFMDRISIEKEERNCILQKPVKNSVGRPRKRKRVEEEKRNKEESTEERLKSERINEQLETKQKEEEEKELSKREENPKQNVKGKLFDKHISSKTPKTRESTTQFSLTHPNSASLIERQRNQSIRTSFPSSADCSTSSSSHIHQCHNLPIESQNQVNYVFSNEKLLSDFGYEGIKNKETTQNTLRRESEETTFVCARVRPFNGAIQTKTQGVDKRPKRNSVQINLANKNHSSQKYSHLRLNSKVYVETPGRMPKIGTKILHFKEQQPDEMPTELHTPIESVLPTNSSPLHKASARFAQSLSATNAVVEADHAYEKASPSLPIGSDAANFNASPVLPVIIDKCEDPVNVYVKNGLVMKNGSCNKNKGTTHASHFIPTLSSLDLMRANELIANQHISTGEVVETSGLDFLASTASLLAPMEPSAVKCNDKIAATSEG